MPNIAGIPPAEKLGGSATPVFPYAFPFTFSGPGSIVTLNLAPSGIRSPAFFGAVSVARVATPHGAAGAEMFGRAAVSLKAAPAGIPTAEQWGYRRPTVGQVVAAGILPSGRLGASTVLTTVYMLGGAFTGLNNYMPAMLQGAITNDNNRLQVQVPYNNMGLLRNTVQAGADMLNTYLVAGVGRMIVFGHSLGAVVASYWLNTYAVTTTVSPARLSFVFIGNSVRPYGGALGPEAGAMWQDWFGPGVAAPAGTNFKVLDIARQYDGWADYPTGTLNPDAQFNAIAGQNLINPSYQNVNPDPAAPGNVAYVVGNITYIWSMTQPVPTLGTEWSSYTDPLDQSLRPTIESAYNRPVTVPTPAY